MFRTKLTRGFIASLIAMSLVVSTNPAWAAPVIELKNWAGTIDFELGEVSPFALQGTASHLGDFRATGEVVFVPRNADGVLDGSGVVAFRTANGDMLVGLVSWVVDVPGDDRHSWITFSWRDSVSFNDGTVVSSTGRFADPSNRPRGLVVIAIIAILVGLLVPCVQRPGCGTTPP